MLSIEIMDLLDDFESARGTFGELGEVAARITSLQVAPGLDEEDPVVIGPTPSTSYDLPALSADLLLRQAAR